MRKRILSAAIACAMILSVAASSITANAATVEPVGSAAAENVKVSKSVYEDFQYYEYDDEISISEYQGSGGDVVIPETINGKPVTSIENSAFSQNI